MNRLNTDRNEKNRILKLHLQEQTSSSASGAYVTPKAWDADGTLTQTNRGEDLVGVEVTMDLPVEVDITDGGVGGFDNMGINTCSSCGGQHDGPCDYSEMPDEIDDEGFEVSIDMDDPLTLDEFSEEDGESDVIPNTLLSLFGDVNIGGDLEIEMDETPKKLKGSRKWRN